MLKRMPKLTRFSTTLNRFAQANTGITLIKFSLTGVAPLEPLLRRVIRRPFHKSFRKTCAGCLLKMGRELSAYMSILKLSTVGAAICIDLRNLDLRLKIRKSAGPNPVERFRVSTTD
jgi:hypothetical protein